jgi:predicted DNA-binding transcriptional regulator AlpA
MARVSISEAARLASVSRPTIYKLLKSGVRFVACRFRSPHHRWHRH